MFGDIGWAELMLIGIVALIVIGPEDLPQMFRQVGRFTAKLRSMSRDFSRAMEQAAKEAGVKDVTDSIKGATSVTSTGLSKVKAAADRFEKWDPMKTVAVPPAPKPAAVATPVEPAPVVAEHKIHGAETQALLNKQAAKKAILLQTAEKLRAVNEGGDAQAATKPAAKRKPATRAKPELQAQAAATPAAKPAAKPRASTKPAPVAKPAARRKTKVAVDT